MTTALEVAIPSHRLPTLTASDLKGQIRLIQEAMRSVMKKGVHYGVVPGTPKPSLWKPGAEVLQTLFHIAPSYRTEDLSDSDCVRYRVTCVGTHQTSGIVMGEGMGEASSNEAKYKWKGAGQREYDATDDSRRRIKYSGKDGEEFETRQVRVEPADVANTILKMACKRAQVAMALNVTGASDMFTQDLEDLPEGVVDPQAQAEQPRTKPATQTPKATNGGKGFATEKQLGMIGKKIDAAGIRETDFLKRFDLGRLDELPFDQVDAALRYIAEAVNAP